MLGQPLQMGYHTTVNWLFGIEVDKEQTRSNWCKRPLTDRQLHYAAMDVVLLPEMFETLVQKLSEKGRLNWLEEEMARALDNARQTVNPETAYLRVSGMGRLDKEGLKALRALAAWRETTARERNLARGFVISDAGLLNLARQRPESGRAARDIEGIHPKALERHLPRLLELIDKASNDDSEVYLPVQLDGPQRKVMGELRNIVQKRARALEIEPALLASRKELERLLRAVIEDRDLPERFTGWRKAAVTDDLLALIG
jgi:ribonuclease D